MAATSISTTPDVGSISLAVDWLARTRRASCSAITTLAPNAAKISGLSLAGQVNAFALPPAAVKKFFPQYAANALRRAFSIAWHRVPYNLGGWSEWTEEARATAYPMLCQPDGRIYLAGEHLSYLNGWQEGAIEVAWQQVAKLHQRVHA